MKKSILLIISLLVIIVLCSVFFYKNTENAKRSNTKVTESIYDDTSSNNKIILGWSIEDKSNYTQLSENKKDIIKIYQEKILEKYNISDIPLESCYIKYSNKDIAFVGCSTGKVGFFFNIFDINKNDLLGDIIGIQSPIESKDYIVFQCLDQNKTEEAICYYKIGETRVSMVPDSSLQLKQEYESYIASVGPGGDDYDMQLTDNKLKVSIYDQRYNDNGLYKKLREVEFTLP